MNNDDTGSIVSRDSLNKIVLENNLINALTKLQHTAFQNELLYGGTPLGADETPESFFGFCIGTHRFMVAASCFCEVIVDAKITSMPNAPSCLVGLTNMRGVLIPIYQLYAALEVEQPKKAIILSVGRAEAAVGILIDALPVALTVSESQRQSVNKQKYSVLQAFIQAEYVVNHSQWFLVNGVEFGHQLLAIAKAAVKPHATLSSLPESFYS